ncbi:hypothetical protein MUK42_07371 [Musa troglodytarum]|uniref:Molybdate-anion transporter n=1 Tax=Musa troglodytarum TaxID=320322 RepID=A0A9E7HFV8_9LILI|nr:hypothetical protein MUK42_07371 [Musa troglodytarum]
MEAFYWLLFGGLAAVVAALEMSKTNRDRASTSSAFNSFKNNYLLVYSLMMGSRRLVAGSVRVLPLQPVWIREGDIGRLFIAGFGSSMLFGTIVGSLADKQGRKRASVTYCITYILSCITKHSPQFKVLMLGRILGGIATSLLFSAFESWLVAEHNKVCSWSNYNLGFGPVAPFDAAACFLAIGMAIILSTWTENYGDPSESKNLVTQFKVAVISYFFCSIASRLLSRAAPKVESYMQLVFAIAAVTLLLPVITSFLVAPSTFKGGSISFGGCIQLFGFCIFEACVGIFWPSIMKMRSQYIPEEARSTIMNFFRIPLNIFVCVVLYNVDSTGYAVMRWRTLEMQELHIELIMNCGSKANNKHTTLIHLCIQMIPAVHPPQSIGHDRCNRDERRDPTQFGSVNLIWCLKTKEVHRERKRESTMGLLSNRVERAEIKAGDHIYSWRAAYTYSHHGIDLPGGKGSLSLQPVFLFQFPISTMQILNPCKLATLCNWEIFSRREEKNIFRRLCWRKQSRSFYTQKDTSDSINSSGSSSLSSGVPSVCPTFPDCGFHQPNSGVILSCLDCFLGNGSLYCFKYGVPPSVFLAKVRGGTCTTAESDPPETVINRAMYLLQNGFGNYDVFENNCEDFALYCKTGLLSLEELGIGRSGQASSFFGVPLAALFSTPFKLLAAGPVGMATVTAGMYCAGRYITDIGVRKDVVKVAVEDLAANLGWRRRCPNERAPGKDCDASVSIASIEEEKRQHL